MMWGAYINNNNSTGTRPIWLEFRSSKWLIGWTAAVAAFTVCEFFYIIIIYIFSFRPKLMSFCLSGGRFGGQIIMLMSLSVP